MTIAAAQTRPAPLGTALEKGLTPRMLNHAAWVTHDVAATADFYTRILGMELASTIFDDHVPSTGDEFPYFHIFFRMADGSTIAFFEVADLPARAKAYAPGIRRVRPYRAAGEGARGARHLGAWLRQNGVELIGPVDHKGMIKSIYFHDPNGIRLELTTPLDKDWNRHTAQGYKDLAHWVETKERAKREGRDPPGRWWT